MKLARIADNEPFYSVLIERDTEESANGENGGGAELFDFSVIVPNTLRPDMPLIHREYLPALMRMQERAGVIQRAQTRLKDAPDNEYRSFRRPLAGETLLPPVVPLAFRRFSAYRAHTANVRRYHGLDALAFDDTEHEDDTPLFTFANPTSLVGHGASIPFPHAGRELDFGLEAAIIIGKTGKDIPVTEGDGYIAGFTLGNGWCLRDVERREMRAGVGPGKSRDFAGSLGPTLVTPDELADRILSDNERGRVYDLHLAAFVNGRKVGTGNLKDMDWTFAELIACASRDTVLHPGDVITGGTLPSGGLLERPRAAHPWLAPGDTVRLEADVLGVLENTIVTPS